MKVQKKVLKDGPNFCFCCGKPIEKEYVLNLGTAGSQFELCRSCLKKLHTKITKVLDAECQG